MRVSAEKVDDLFDAVGETVLHSGRLGTLLDPAGALDREQVGEELAHGGALLEELQHSVIQMRTLPLSSITGTFPRAVRDLAAAQGKQVELEVTGAETQLDRVILDGISESISHLLSNAVVHGMETPAERGAVREAGLRPRGAARRSARGPRRDRGPRRRSRRGTRAVGRRGWCRGARRHAGAGRLLHR